MRGHTCSTRSRAWASRHHIGTSRVHRPPSAQPLSGGTQPPTHRLTSSPTSGEPPPPSAVWSRPLHTPLRVGASLRVSDIRHTSRPRSPHQGSWVYYLPPYRPPGPAKSFHSEYKPTNIETVDYGVSVRGFGSVFVSFLY